MIVIDVSVLVNALTDDGAPGDVAQEELARDGRWAAPEHVRVEVFSGIRGRVLGGKITARRGEEAVEALAAMDVELVDFSTLHRRMWELSENVTGYDAACVAAAEAKDCPLVTADGAAARATGPRCEIRLALPARGPRAPASLRSGRLRSSGPGRGPRPGRVRSVPRRAAHG